jgi:plasmid stabilization system protein ParE
MKYRLIIQPPAFDDIERAYKWMAERSPEGAGRWLEGLLRALETLTAFPRRCERAPESRFVDAEIRQLLYGRRANRYRALFTIRRRRYTFCTFGMRRADTSRPKTLSFPTTKHVRLAK